MLKQWLRTKTETDDLQELMQDLSWESGSPSDSFRSQLQSKLLTPKSMSTNVLSALALPHLYFSMGLVAFLFAVAVINSAMPIQYSASQQLLDTSPTPQITANTPTVVPLESTYPTSPGHLVSKKIFTDYRSPIDTDCKNVRQSRGLSVYHNGVDITADDGCKVVAMQEGTVIYADWFYITGFTVRIQHADGYQTNYHHGKENLLVKVGDKVAKGQPLMYMGRTGRATGIHLHVEIVRDGKYYDPDYYIDLIP